MLDSTFPLAYNQNALMVARRSGVFSFKKYKKRKTKEIKIKTK